MSCCQYFRETESGAKTFTVAMPKITFGAGALKEIGARCQWRKLTRIALFTDPWLAKSDHLAKVRDSLAAAHIEFEEFDAVEIEPSDISCQAAAEFYAQANAQGIIAVGGGSVMDSAKAAVAYATYPRTFTDYFGPPIGKGVPLPFPLPPIIACPTTGGTGSEATAVTVVKISALNTKFVLQSPALMPVEAIIDPTCALTLPSQVVASSGFDLLCHALECFTARAYTQWDAVVDPLKRPTNQGANPWSDIHAREALRIAGEYLLRGVEDAQDIEARGQLMWGATLAGMAFGNSGTHMPHALSYGISHLVKSWRSQGYPHGGGPFIPHGVAVAVNAPAVFKHIAPAAPQRHLLAAQELGATKVGRQDSEDAGDILAARMIELMRGASIPNGLSAIGFAAEDTQALTASAIRQTRAIANAPGLNQEEDVATIYADAMSYW